MASWPLALPWLIRELDWLGRGLIHKALDRLLVLPCVTTDMLLGHTLVSWQVIPP